MRETLPCSGCGELKPVELLDAKDLDSDGDFESILCEGCYGPGWAPAYDNGKEGVAS